MSLINALRCFVRREQYLDAGLQAAFAPAEAREDEPANVHEEGSTDDVPVYQVPTSLNASHKQTVLSFVACGLSGLISLQEA